LWYADGILLAGAARGRTRIYANTIPSDHGTPEPGGIRRDRTSAKPAPYVAVPPGHQVAGMAHARIVVKQKKATRHRSRHARKKAVSPAAAVETLTETAKPSSKP